MKHIAFLTIIIMAIFSFIPASAQKIAYPPKPLLWKADSLGTHRAVIHVSGNQPIAKGTIIWRRRDWDPDKKMMILVDSLTGEQVKNVKFDDINRISCTLYFQTNGNHDTYFLYYMPYRHKGSPYYPKDYYPDFVTTAAADWLRGLQGTSDFAAATLDKIEAVDSFNSFYPMEEIASRHETDSLVNAHPTKKYLVFPEDRMHIIKMDRDLPYRWIQKGVQHQFADQALKGENFAFQLGVYAAKTNLENVTLEFSDAKNGQSVLPASLFTCINTDGIDYKGNKARYRVNIPKGKIRSLWTYIPVPDDAQPGIYKGTIRVKAQNAPSTSIDFQLEVLNDVAQNNGVDEPWKMTRLPWLNSTIGQENTVIPPYTPIKVNGDKISILGRQIELQPNGLPAQIQTFFPIEMTSISSKPTQNILSSPIEFRILDHQKRPISFKSQDKSYTLRSDGTLEWTAHNQSGDLTLEVDGHLEFDGFLSYTVRLIAKEDVSLTDIALNIPVEKSAAGYFMGLGNKGGHLNDDIHWKWDVKEKNQEGGWIGTVNAGIRFSLRDQHYERPLNTNFYLLKPLHNPTSWGNGDKGGINITKEKSHVSIDAYSGSRTMKKGDTLYYNFNLLITPFHALDIESHWKNRYFHAYKPIDSVRSEGGNVINIHQGNFINPYINYPFIATDQMKAYIDSAHKAGMKVKIYNTIRELANRAYELYPLFSLGHEIFPSGDGGGYPWLQEHLNGDYIGGWYTPETNDAAIVNGGASRWHNYYIAGLDWLVKHVGIDGLYLDDVAFDRITMKRLKRELVQNGHPGLIDLHSANQHNKSDGWNNSAILYLSLMPYINRLWFGEYFDYEHNSPDFYMTEVSGIPFGLMGEMLQDGGNPWRGMLYGMTSRLPWTDSDPRPIWKLWDEFGISGSKMIGYWVPDQPVQSDHPDVKITTYQKAEKVLLAIANWADQDTTIHLKIDWKQLHINRETAKLFAPEVKGLQSNAEYNPDEAIPVAKGKGIFLILE